MAFEHIEVRRDHAIERVQLARPDVRNAMNDALIDELTRWASTARRDTAIRAAVLSGAGKVFSAGADLDWMRRAADYTHEQNVHDARALADLLDELDRLPFPVIGQVHGAALGGGAGLVAVCDVAVAAKDTTFGFPEVRLGVVPAVIGPFVVAKIGVSAARELFVTGRRFDARRARAIGLIHQIEPAPALAKAVDTLAAETLEAGPEAVGCAKELVRQLAGRTSTELRDVTSELIAARRASAEGREGMRAFLEKRAPSWRR